MSRLRLAKGMQIRWFATKEKIKVVDTLNEQLTNEEVKHRNHPGILKPRCAPVPPWALNTVKKIVQEEELKPKMVTQSAHKLVNHLHNRHLPLEEHEIKEKIRKIKVKVKDEGIAEIDEGTSIMKVPQTKKLVQQNIYAWSPVKYNQINSLLYLVGRGIPEYSVLYKIFNEIKSKDADFKPETLFDFGSGVGTVLWAASEFWSDSLKEHFCVDVSADMNDLSERILKDANLPIKNVFYRQFFPASPNPVYDIVVSAYSLFELPSLESRVEVISKLWRKTNNYLVIVEQGSRAGFTAVKDARDFVLHRGKKKWNTVGAHVFAPCPHDLECPRSTTDDTPCNFELKCATLPISGPSVQIKERYSYVVLKKGGRPETDPGWPRIVRPTIKRSGHVICRMCTASGTLEEQIFTQWKNGKNTYRCARCSEWGDRLPFEIEKAE